MAGFLGFLHEVGPCIGSSLHFIAEYTDSPEEEVQNHLLPVPALKFWRTAPGVGVAAADLTCSLEDLGPLGQTHVSRRAPSGLLL